jgi:hypothetical protein
MTAHSLQSRCPRFYCHKFKNPFPFQNFPSPLSNDITFSFPRGRETSMWSWSLRSLSAYLAVYINLFIYHHNTSPVYNGFIHVNLLHVSVYKRPSSGKYTLLTHSQSIELHGYIHHSIIVITDTLNFQQYYLTEYYKLCIQNKTIR